MKKTSILHPVPAIASLAVLMAMPASVHAASVLNATRVSIDAIVGETDTTGSDPKSLGYYIGAAGVSNTTVGVTGSNVTGRHGQDLVYRYTLPTLAVGQTIQSFTFSFTITQFRNHSNSDPDGNDTEFGLDVYLLGTADPTTTGDDLYLRDTTDPNTANALVGAMDPLIPEPSDSDQNQDVNVVVTYTINSGPALALLQSFYVGHEPIQDEASFRFNLDTEYEGSIRSRGLNRYIIDSEDETSSFSITAIPEPTTALLGCLGMLALLRRRR